MTGGGGIATIKAQVQNKQQNQLLIACTRDLQTLCARDQNSHYSQSAAATTTVAVVSDFEKERVEKNQLDFLMVFN
jgi:hypothetical protein